MAKRPENVAENQNNASTRLEKKHNNNREKRAVGSVERTRRKLVNFKDEKLRLSIETAIARFRSDEENRSGSKVSKAACEKIYKLVTLLETALLAAERRSSFQKATNKLIKRLRHGDMTLDKSLEAARSLCREQKNTIYRGVKHPRSERICLRSSSTVIHIIPIHHKNAEIARRRVFAVGAAFKNCLDFRPRRIGDEIPEHGADVLGRVISGISELYFAVFPGGLNRDALLLEINSTTRHLIQIEHPKGNSEISLQSAVLYDICRALNVRTVDNWKEAELGLFTELLDAKHKPSIHQFAEGKLFRWMFEDSKIVKLEKNGKELWARIHSDLDELLSDNDAILKLLSSCPSATKILLAH